MSGNELPQCRQIAQHLRRVGGTFAQIAFEGSSKNPFAQTIVNSRAHPDHHLAPYPLKRAAQHEQAQDDQAQHYQRSLVPAGQDAIEDLHHVDRRRQHQEIDHSAEQRQAHEYLPVTQQGGIKFTNRIKGKLHVRTILQARHNPTCCIAIFMFL